MFGVMDLEATMKRLLIRLTGLMVTAAIMLSAGGTAFAAETDGQDNDTGVATTQPAEIPDTKEPSKDEVQGPVEPAYEPGEPAEDPDAPAADPAGAPAEEPAADPDAPAPAEEPAGAPAADPEAPAEEKPTEGAEAGEPAKDEQTKGCVTKTAKIKIDMSNDELAQGYINSVFGKSTRLTKRSFNYEAQFENNEVGLSVYRYLRSQISKIASGEISSTVIECEKISYTAEDLGLENLNDTQQALNAGLAKISKDLDLDDILNVLLQSSPYDLYWFNKTDIEACSLAYSYSYPFYGTVDFYPVFSFKVASDYSANDEYTVNSIYGTSVRTAHNNALGIISLNASLDDYNKLKAYRDAICDYTEYNNPAAGGGVDYGNPWQMVWVFDGDPNTTVVCEGYSKAFQFLCDNSTFQNSNIYAICVSGKADFNDGREPGPHMWNIVHMDDGKNYLVDVTNCDSLSNVYGRDVLFLRGKSGNSTRGNGYLISIPNSSSIYDYFYTAQQNAYQKPDIATSDYVYNPGPEPITEPAFAASHGMVLAGEIGVKFIVEFPENYDGNGCYVDFQISSGRSGRVNYSDSLVKPENSNERYFIFFVNPIELADTITATLNYGDGNTAENTYSAMAYIQYVQNNLKDDPARTELVALINSLHDYGYYMQQSGWGDGNTHTAIAAPVKALGQSDINAATNGVSGYTMNKQLGDSGIEDSVKVGLTIASQTELRVSVKPGSGINITSTGYTLRTIDNEQYYQFSKKNIGPKALGNNMSYVITTGQGSATINVSVMYYVKIAIASNTLNSAQLLALTAYYNYYQAAMAYPES